MLTKEQKEAIADKIIPPMAVVEEDRLQYATVEEFTRRELEHTIDNIENILESTLGWIDGAMYREMNDFTNVEARKKRGLGILSIIIKERMK